MIRADLEVRAPHDEGARSGALPSEERRLDLIFMLLSLHVPLPLGGEVR